jgi:hypothetical protein
MQSHPAKLANNEASLSQVLPVQIPKHLKRLGAAGLAHAVTSPETIEWAARWIIDIGRGGHRVGKQTDRSRTSRYRWPFICSRLPRCECVMSPAQAVEIMRRWHRADADLSDVHQACAGLESRATHRHSSRGTLWLPPPPSGHASGVFGSPSAIDVEPVHYSLSNARVNRRFCWANTREIGRQNVAEKSVVPGGGTRSCTLPVGIKSLSAPRVQIAHGPVDA